MVPKTLNQMKKRLAEAMSQASEAEEIIPLMKAAIARFELVPADLFDAASKVKAAPQKSVPSDSKNSTGAGAMYRDFDGNTWAGRGRRPTWLNDALARGKTLEEFRVRGKHLRSAK